MPFHIVIAGDFAGANPERPPKAIEVDRDNLDAVLARVRPLIELPLAGADGKPLALRIGGMEEFHPDHLYRHLPVFEAIRATVTDEPEAPPPPPPAPVVAPPKTGGGFLDDILENTEERYSAAQPAPARNDWDDTLRRIATSNALPKQSPLRERREADARQASALLMRAILHSPQFRIVENAWRGLDFLVRRVETGSELRIFLLDVSRSQLPARLAKAGDDEWSVVLANYMFGAGEADISALSNLANAAAGIGVPVIAAANPLLLGCEDLDDLSDVREWRDLPPAARNAWTALRKNSNAAWLGLALPRLLIRVPYGADSSPCEEFSFEEMDETVASSDLSWANPIFACAAMLGESWTDFGEPDAKHDLDGLLSYSWRESGVPRFQPVGETLLTDRAVEAILEHGLIPLMSSKYGTEIRIPRFQSVADPPLPLEFPTE